MRESPKEGDSFVMPSSGYRADYDVGDRIAIHGVYSKYLYFKDKTGAVFANGSSVDSVRWDAESRTWIEGETS